jgi:hypothetical protein
LLGVRGWGQLAKALIASNEDWAKSTTEVEKSGAALRGANKDLDATAEEFKKLDGALKGLSIALYEHFKKPIDDSLVSLGDLITKTKDAADGTQSWVDVLRAIDPGDFQFFDQIKAAWGSLDDWIKAHSGYGANLLPESWTTPHPFVGRDIPGATPEEAATLAQIRAREGAAGGYRAVAGERGPVLSDLSRYPAELGKAAGAYQFRPSTWAEAAGATGVTGFTAEDQDKAALWLLRRYGTKPWAASAPPGGYPSPDLEAQRGRALGAGPMAEGGAEGEPRRHVDVVNVEAERKAYEDRVKGINQEQSAREAWLNYEITAAKGDAAAIAALEQQKVAVGLETYEKLKSAAEAYYAKTGNDERVGQAGYIKLLDEKLKSAQRADAELLGATLTRLEGERKLADEREAADLAAEQRRWKLGDETVAQFQKNEEAIVANHQAAVDKILQQEQTLAKGRLKLEEDVAARLKQSRQKDADEMLKVHDETMSKMKADTDKAVGPIDSAFNTIAQNMISRTQTVQQVMSKVFQQLVTGPLLKNIENAFTKGMEGTGFGESGLGRFFTGTLFSGGGTGAAATQTATALALNTAATSVNTTVTAANSTAQSGGLLGGLGSLFRAIPIIGAIFEHGGIVSAQGGMVTGSGLTIGLLHPREMVLPAGISTGMQGLINSGMSGGNSYNASLVHSPTINMNGNSAMNRSQIEGLLRTHGDVLLSHARNLMRNGWAP